MNVWNDPYATEWHINSQMISNQKSIVKKEQSCGTCEYFTKNSNDTDGACWWFCENKTPFNNTSPVPTTSTWGKDCPCWIEKV